MKLKNIRRILVFRIGQLGDTIVALPAFWAIREFFPAAHMALLRDEHPDKNYISPDMVLPRKGLFDQYISYTANAEGIKTKNLVKLIPLLLKNKFDALVYLYPSRRSPWQVWRDCTFFRLGGIKSFIGTHGFGALPRSVPNRPLPTVESESDHLLKRLALSGIRVPPLGCGKMNLDLTESEIAEGDDWIENHVHPGKLRSIVGIGPGSKMSAKVWPLERFLELGSLLIDEFGVIPIIFGSAEEKELGDRLISEWSAGINAIGELTVRQAAAVLSRCRLYVGNDTGTMHLASAVKKTCVAIFSARDWPGRWYPYGLKHIILRESVDCEGCMLQICNRNKECLKKIQVESVIRECRQILYHRGVGS